MFIIGNCQMEKLRYEQHCSQTSHLLSVNINITISVNQTSGLCLAGFLCLKVSMKQGLYFMWLDWDRFALKFTCVVIVRMQFGLRS